MDESYQPTMQDMRDLALLDNTTDWYQIAQMHLAELIVFNAPVRITDTLSKWLDINQGILQENMYSYIAHNHLVTAWANAQNWLAEHRGGIA